jgi:hypothetical protein
VRLALGAYEVVFSRNVTRCAYVATIGLSGSSGVSPSGAITVVGRFGNPNGVFIATSNSGGTPTDLGFPPRGPLPKGRGRQLKADCYRNKWSPLAWDDTGVDVVDYSESREQPAKLLGLLPVATGAGVFLLLSGNVKLVDRTPGTAKPERLALGAKYYCSELNP